MKRLLVIPYILFLLCMIPILTVVSVLVVIADSLLELGSKLKNGAIGR